MIVSSNIDGGCCKLDDREDQQGDARQGAHAARGLFGASAIKRHAKCVVVYDTGRN